MTTKIIDRNKLVYIKNYGFVTKFKLGVFAFLLAFSAIVFVRPSMFLGSADAYSMDSLQYVPKKERIVSYMQEVNHDISKSLATDLADAILFEEKKYKLPVELQLSLIKSESKFDQYALSKVGALGFYQVMAGVHANKVFDLYHSGIIATKNIYDPLTNATLGAIILSDCLHRVNNNLSRALMCYNGSSQSSGEYSTTILSNAKVIKERLFAVKNIAKKAKKAEQIIAADN